jgi:hypothetical protein
MWGKGVFKDCIEGGTPYMTNQPLRFKQSALPQTNAASVSPPIRQLTKKRENPASGYRVTRGLLPFHAIPLISAVLE